MSWVYARCPKCRSLGLPCIDQKHTIGRQWPQWLTEATAWTALGRCDEGLPPPICLSRDMSLAAALGPSARCCASAGIWRPLCPSAALSLLSAGSPRHGGRARGFPSLLSSEFGTIRVRAKVEERQGRPKSVPWRLSGQRAQRRGGCLCGSRRTLRRGRGRLAPSPWRAQQSPAPAPVARGAWLSGSDTWARASAVSMRGAPRPSGLLLLALACPLRPWDSRFLPSWHWPVP